MQRSALFLDLLEFRLSIFEEVNFELSFERWERTSHRKLSGQSSPGRGDNKLKALWLETDSRNTKKSSIGRMRSERWGGLEHTRLMGHDKVLVFYSMMKRHLMVESWILWATLRFYVNSSGYWWEIEWDRGSGRAWRPVSRLLKSSIWALKMDYVIP